MTEPATPDYEKLGVFYLGRERDMEKGETTGREVLYDSRDLTTHAVVVGMTGSGKTGLCLGILEEAGLDRIPAIVIDPKGDIANLLLTFPDLKPDDFLPWVDPSQASREGKTREEFAASESARWKSGLQKWGQDGERIRRLRESVELRVYTPGSSAGRPLTILRSFSAPPPELKEDSDLFLARIVSAASGLLALLGIDADPIRSREHILIAQILRESWEQGADLDLEKLIGKIQSPSFRKVGMMELDVFFPPKDRLSLAMTLNNLLASPSFESWMKGETLNVKSLLHTAEGKPCISILSIAHLSDAERMFFVTILLNEVLGWMRSQAGTNSLRAILYMDEIFGYFPPTLNPPSKQPMLTLLKQARAYGLGVLLATQNPVDLDYKGLGNCGTWFLGHLQTERDKMRVIEGLEGAAAQSGGGFSRAAMEKTLAGLGSRIFLLNNAHEDAAVVFETRWAMSYLRGPMTRLEIQRLLPSAASDASPLPPAAENAAPALPEGTAGPGAAAESRGDANSENGEAEPSGPGSAALPGAVPDARQAIPEGVEQRFAALDRRPGGDESLIYRAALFGRGRLHFIRSAAGIDVWEDRMVIRQVGSGDSPMAIWENAQRLVHPIEWLPEPAESASLELPPPVLQAGKNYVSWQKLLKEYFYREHSLTLFHCAELGMTSGAGETEGDFRVRLETAISERRDAETEKMRQKFAARFQQLRDQIDRAQASYDREKTQYQSRRMETVLTVGQSLIGALLGRRTSRVAGARSAGMATRDRQEMQQAEENMESLQLRFRDLETEFNAAMASIAAKPDSTTIELAKTEIPPRKSDVSVAGFFVAWLPWTVDRGGRQEAAWSG